TDLIRTGGALHSEGLIVVVLRHTYAAGVPGLAARPRDCLFLVFNVDELCIDHIVLRLLGLSAGSRTCTIAARRSARSTAPRTAGLRLVHGLRQFVARLGESIGSLADLFHGAAGHGLAGGIERGFHVFRVVIADLVAMILEHLLDLVHHRVSPVAGVDFILALAVVGAMRLGVLGHLVDFLFAQAGGRRDGDLLFIVGGLVLRRDIQDAVG